MILQGKLQYRLDLLKLLFSLIFFKEISITGYWAFVIFIDFAKEIQLEAIGRLLFLLIFVVKISLQTIGLVFHSLILKGVI